MIPTKCLVFRFSDIEVHEQELRATRGGEALDLEPKAFRVLVYLVKNAGRLVTKSELIDAVWGGTAVTDNSLTRVIALLRRVLEDDSRQPRFIETVSTAGYRFICPVESDEPSVSSRLSETEPIPEAATGEPLRAAAVSTNGARGAPQHQRRWAFIAGVSVVVLSVAAVLWYASRPLPSPHISETVRITNDPRSTKQVVGTDGTRIYLNLDVMSLGEVPMTGGEITKLPIKGFAEQLSPDGMSLLVFGDPDPKDQARPLSVIGTSGGPSQPLTRAVTAGWSGDGKKVVYSTPRGEIYEISSSGGEPRLLRALDAPGTEYPFASSPEGTRIRFNWGPRKLMEMSSDGSNLHEILAGWHPNDFKCCSTWSPDGSLFLFFSTASQEIAGNPAFQIWALDERRRWLRKEAPEPVQLTFGPMTWIDLPAFTRDGKKILANGNIWQGELVRYNRQTRQVEPFLDGISADMVNFSRDGRFVLYAPFPGNVLVRANRDGSGAEQVMSGYHPVNPRWSPDNSQIVYGYDNQDGPTSTYVVSAQGGTPSRVLPDNKCCNEGDPTWSPDGKRLAIWVESPEGKTESEIQIVDVSTHQVSYLPRPPKRTWSPRWSPDGRYIVCLTNPYPNTDGLEVYDFKTQRWRIVLVESGSGNWPSWSHDSRWIYYVASSRSKSVIIDRVSVDGGKPERIVELAGFATTGWNWGWFDLDPDDNPLLLRGGGSNEVYALTLER